MEAELIRKVKAGDKEAFRSLYERYADKAIRTAAALTNDSASAADAVQETFLRVYRNIGSYDEKKPFQPWFNRILLNECNRYMKKQAKLIPVDPATQHGQAAAVEPYAFEQYDPLYQSIRELDEIHRVPIVLKYMYDFTEQTISSLLDLNLNTVKSRLHKARGKLRETLVRYERKGGYTDG